MDKIFDGEDKAKELGYLNYVDMVLELASIKNKQISNEAIKNNPVYARIDFGRWLADCECGAANYISRSNLNFYYCVTCGNIMTNGKVRSVVMPDNFQEIEIELLRRKVFNKFGLSGTNGAMNSIGPISRSWSPGETIEMLIAQREMTEAQ